MASLPLCKFTATVSSIVLTLNVDKHHAVLEPLEPGLHARRTPLPTYLLRTKLNIEHPFRKTVMFPDSRPGSLAPL